MELPYLIKSSGSPWVALVGNFWLIRLELHFALNIYKKYLNIYKK